MIRDCKHLSNRIKTYPYGTNTFKVWESEKLMVKDLFLKNYNKSKYKNDQL